MGQDSAKEHLEQKIMHQELVQSFEEEDRASYSSRKPVALQEKKVQKFFMSGAVRFTATVECLTMAMRWCDVLPGNFGFMVSAKWVILIAHIGGLTLPLPGSKPRMQKEEGCVQGLQRCHAKNLILQKP